MLEGVSTQQLTLLAILLAACFLLITERIRIDVIAVLLILALAGTGILDAREALSGFSSEPALVVASVFVLSGAVFHTGLSDRLGYWIGRLAGRGYTRMLTIIMTTVATLSAFTHHVTITAAMLPVILRLSREQGIPPSRLLIPMSFAASLGTTISIIGAPAFLIADSVLRRAGRSGLSIFSIAPIGLALSLAGTFFMLLAGRLLLPDRPGSEDAGNHFRLDGYYTEIVLLAGSPLIEKGIDEVEANDDGQLRVMGWLRDGHPLSRPFGDQRLQAGDVLIVRTTPERIAAIRQEPGVDFHSVAQTGHGGLVSKGEGSDVSEWLIQAVVAPGSYLAGRALGTADLYRQYGVIAIGIWRHRGWLRTELARVKLREGDVLVLLGDKVSFGRVAQDPSFLLLVPFQGEPQLRHKAPVAGALMIASLLAVTLNLLSVEIGLLAVAAAVVLAGCLTPRQAYQSIDVRIFTFIAGVIPVGLAMEKTGTTDLLAGWLQGVVQGWSPFLILLILFAGAALVTQVMSDAATTALLAPVAVILARAMGHAPEPYAVTVAMAAVASFLTPIGHHGNLLIYGPGGYQFSDFLKIGVPMTALVAILVAPLALLLWPG